MAIPSRRQNGSPSISMPISEGAAIAFIGVDADVLVRWGAGWIARCADAAAVWATVRHLMPAGNPAPPRPRRPESITSTTTSSGIDPARPSIRPCRHGPGSHRGRVDRSRRRVRKPSDPAWPDSRVRPQRRGSSSRPSRPQEVMLNLVRASRSTTRSGFTCWLLARSTSGSSQSIPRLPVRTTASPRAARAAATSSAPTDRAAASCGTYQIVIRAPAVIAGGQRLQAARW